MPKMPCTGSNPNYQQLKKEITVGEYLEAKTADTVPDLLMSKISEAENKDIKIDLEQLTNVDLNEDPDLNAAKPNTRFPKGTSGNPRGRPKKKRFEGNIGRLLFEELKQELQISENGKPMTTSVARALVKSVIANAVKGKPTALIQVLKLISDSSYYAHVNRLVNKDNPYPNVEMFNETIFPPWPEYDD